MKKNNKLGFVLAETIIISTIVMTSLVFIFVQFSSINNSFNRTFKYNSVNNLYLTNNIKEYINNDGIDKVITALNQTNVGYIDITSCPVSYFTEYLYCRALMDNINAKKVLFTRNDVYYLQDNIDSYNEFENSLKTFIKYISPVGNNSYRIIVQFEDDTYATLQI